MSLKTRKKLSKEEITKITKYQRDLTNGLNLAQTFSEYFLILGIDPRISMRNYLYNTEPNEILKFYSNEIKAEILSKYPPMKKNYINIDNSILDICFQNDFKIQEFSSKPEPETLFFLLDNYFYSIDYPHKYVTCLKFYENLESYDELKEELQKKMGNNYNGKIPKYDGAASNVNYFLKIEESDDLYLDYLNGRKKSDELGDEILIKKRKDKLKNLYFPKIICLISLQPFYKEQELILRKIYDYYLSKEKKKIPLEKIILNFLCNIPMPPNGLFEISYKFNNEINENNDEIKIKRNKLNELKNIDYTTNFMLSIYNIENFLEIFKYSLYETKTLLFSSQINNLSIFINGILSLLYPFNYSFQVSSCVPNNAFDLLESISPYILGINQKYTESFFTDNKIEIEEENLLIIDIDNKNIIIKVKNKENYPNLPKCYLKKLKSGIEDILKKQKSSHKSKKKEDLNLFSSLFFDFFLNMMYDYSDYLNNDYFFNKSKYKNSNIQGLFKIKDFINNHSSNEKSFLQAFVNTQMFSDFIFKKMLPKNINDKMEILFFDENINKKNNEKILLFGKKNVLFFLNSEEYQYKYIYNVPKVKELSQEEKYRYDNKNYKLKNLFLGQNIENEYNNNTDDFDYFFDYILFPVLNNDYFYFPHYDYYFTRMINDIDRINTDILSKSQLDSLEDDGGMLNYIYLAYIQMWGYCYYYQSGNEKDYRFNQLIKILNKVYHHEIELFNFLFESLNKFQESDKILKLYERLLSYKITPNSFIYSIICKIIDKDKKSKVNNNKCQNEENNNYNDIEKYLKSSSYNINNGFDQDFQRRTFRDEKEKNILGDLIIFKTNQICPECGKEINIEDMSLNFKNMKKDTLWAQCPLCNKYILPRLTVKLGNDIGLVEESSKTTKFILHSPYELKVNLKESIDKKGSQFLEVEKFKMEYPSLFWSCIWYFRLLKIDYDIMLPYESNIFSNQKENRFQININSNINSDKIKENNIINKEHKKKKINKKYYCNLIIQNILSFYYSNNRYHKYNFGNIKENNKEKISNFITRRTTTIFNSTQKYNSLSSFINYSQKNNNDNNIKNKETWKRITLKDKIINKFQRNFHIEEKE